MVSSSFDSNLVGAIQRGQACELPELQIFTLLGFHVPEGKVMHVYYFWFLGRGSACLGYNDPVFHPKEYDFFSLNYFALRTYPRVPTRLHLHAHKAG